MSDESPVSRALLVLCVNQGIWASFSLLLSIIDSIPPGSSILKDHNTNGSLKKLKKKKKKLEKNDKENITPQNLFVVFIKLLSPVPPFATPWAAARQAPLSTISQFPQIHIHGATDAI